MIKKNKSRHAAPAGPQTAQLDSIERLLSEERYHEAHAKAQRLAREFPTHSRLRDLRIQAAAHTGELAIATLLADEWTQAHPNSQRAWGLLYGLASEMGMGYLSQSAHERLNAMGATDSVRDGESKENMALTRAKYPGLEGEEGLRSDRGLLYLINERLDDARAVLEGAVHLVPRTNLAAVFYDKEDMAAAIEQASAAWELDIHNAHAARTLVRAQLYSGDVDGAKAAGEKLKTMSAREPDELAAQLETLDLLGEFDAARSCYDAFPQKNFADYRRDVVARTRHAAAVAFWHTGDRARASTLWEQAAAENSAHPLYRAMLGQSKREDSDEPAWLEVMADSFPALRARALEKDIDDAGGVEAIMQEPESFESEIVAHSAYLGRILRLADPLMRTIAREELSRRAERGESAAMDELAQFLSYACCTDGERIEALRRLYFSGRFERKQDISIFLAGKQRTLPVEVPEVKGRAPFEGLPEQAARDYVSAVFATEPGPIRASLAAVEKWLVEAPTRLAQLVLNHRAILLLHALRGQEAQARTRLQAALDEGDALPRTYAFAARIALAEEDQDKAAGLLEGQLARAGRDDEDLMPVLLAQRELHNVRGEEEQAQIAWIAYEALGAFESTDA